jgi:replicative DNA helicase
MLDTTILRLFSSRDRYERMRKAVPDRALGDVTQVLLADYGKYYQLFPNATKIEREPFWSWFKTFGHPNLSKEQFGRYEQVIGDISKPVPEELEAGFAGQLVAADVALKLADMLERWNEGDEVNLNASLRELMDYYDTQVDKKVKTPLVTDDINDLLEDDASGRGFKWRLDSLNMSMRPMLPGDFGLIAARPDVGKTTYLTDQLSFFAPQLSEVFPEECRSILWFNNEGPGRRIKKRVYQSALNATYTDLLDMQRAGTLRPKFVQSMGGREDAILIYDIHDFWNWEVEEIIRATNPGIIVFDMIDNIKFGGSASNNGQRTDQLLEAMYQWARVIGVKHDCVVLANSQISAEGENMQYPLLSMLKDSKTGKQGAADFILTIGLQSTSPDTRFLGLTKNKLAVEGGPKGLKSAVIFDGQRGRYVEPTMVDEVPEQASSDPLEN